MTLCYSQPMRSHQNVMKHNQSPRTCTVEPQSRYQFFAFLTFSFFFSLLTCFSASVSRHLHLITTKDISVCKNLACSRLRDSGEKSLRQKEMRKTLGGCGVSPPPPPFPSRASYFRFACFNTSALYYLRAWHRLVKTRKTGWIFIALNCSVTLVGVCNMCLFLSAVLAQSLNFSVISSVCALFEFLVAFDVLFHTFTVIRL